MNFTPRQYADMAIYLASDIDLGNATASELDSLAVQAIGQGWGYEVTYSDGTTERIGR